MTDDIVKRLRERSLWETDVDPAMLLEETADEIERLRAALKPFADEASVGPMPGEPNDPRRCNMKFLLAAKAALEGNDTSKA